MTQSLARASRDLRDTHSLAAGAMLVRRLAAWNATPVAASNEAFAERLSRWFEWREAIALSGALNAAPSAPAQGVALRGDVEAEARRVRAALEAAIQPSPKPVPAGRPGRPAPVPPERDLAFFRQRHVAAQREMSTRIAALRGRLRATLAARSPAMAKLAALDAVMAQVVGDREHLLLGSVSRWLQPRFPQQADEDALRRFERDLQAVLQAELDLRWQPVEALLEALRPRPSPPASP